VPFSLVPTPTLELLLEQSDHPQANQAVIELIRLRDANCHLLTHFVAVQNQTKISAAGIKSVLGDVRPEPGQAVMLHGKGDPG
jgi:hypothetical protein